MRKLAIIGGLSYVMIFITAIFANFFVLEQVKVVGDNAATFQNIQKDVPLFTLAILSLGATVLFDFLLSWIFYKIFKEQNERLAKISAWLRFIYTLFLAGALIYLVQVVDIVQNNIATQHAIEEVAFRLEAFNIVWLAGLVLFGIHLMLLGVLLIQSKRVFKIIPIPLMIAGVGYVIDSMLQFFYNDYASIAEVSVFVVVLPGIVGELSLTGWLLFRAGNINHTHHKSRNMKKIKLIMLVGGILAMTTSCASMFEKMEVECEEDRVQPDKCEIFEFQSDSICE